MMSASSKKASRRQNRLVRFILIFMAVVLAFFKFDQAHSNYSLSSHQINYNYENDTQKDGGNDGDSDASSTIETSSTYVCCIQLAPSSDPGNHGI